MHLHEDAFLHRRCVVCPSQAPSCNCGVGQQCIITSRVCDACPSASCVDASNGSSSNNSGGVSGGAIAGAVIGALAFLGASVWLWFWYRRRQRAAEKNANAQGTVSDPKPDVPARAEAVLSRPDPVEKSCSPSPQHENGHAPESVRMYSVMSNSTINLDPQHSQSQKSQRGPSHRGSVQSDPFTDTHSIQTTSASTQSTNVIPIALVPHGSVSSSPHSPGATHSGSGSNSDSSSPSTTAPARPAHAPELGLRFDPLSSSLNLEHVNVSKESFTAVRPSPNAAARYAQSQVSGISGFSSRDSVMTSGSFASDVLYEAPQIVTNAGRVNVLKAEVVSVNGTAPGTPMSSNSGSNLKPNSTSRVSKTPARSPLAQSSFGPADAISVSESDEGQEVEYHLHLPHHHRHPNPFGDEHSPRLLHSGNSAGSSSFGGTTPIPIPSTAGPDEQYHGRGGEQDRGRESSENDSNDSDDRDHDIERPVSTLTQATSIIGAEIGGATVVRLNSINSARSAHSANSANSYSSHRLTSARLVTPTSGPLRKEDDRVLQQQQAQALAAARARAAASGLPMPGSRVGGNSNSHASVISTSSSTSTGMGGQLLHSRRVSEASVMSAGADSLLENFTFVPPSPISSRPVRAPSSPLAYVHQAQIQAKMVPPVPPLPKEHTQGQGRGLEGEGQMQGQGQTKRALQGMSGMSGMSSASTGIEGYDFRLQEGEAEAETGREGEGEEQMRASVASTFGTGSNLGKGPSTNPLSPLSPLSPPRSPLSASPRSPASVRTRGETKSPHPPSAADNNHKNLSNGNGNGSGGLKGRQRASLDTLALTADLSAFPLNFDGPGSRTGTGAGPK